ncbi:hypothetical protein B0H12DRAFT_1072236 [Mycena haematopus]|nr:hypothetical protein B0H12DRAFT_1072236 [Mycena haematopus]
MWWPDQSLAGLCGMWRSRIMIRQAGRLRSEVERASVHDQRAGGARARGGGGASRWWSSVDRRRSRGVWRRWRGGGSQRGVLSSSGMESAVGEGGKWDDDEGQMETSWSWGKWTRCPRRQWWLMNPRKRTISRHRERKTGRRASRKTSRKTSRTMDRRPKTREGRRAKTTTRRSFYGFTVEGRGFDNVHVLSRYVSESMHVAEVGCQVGIAASDAGIIQLLESNRSVPEIL